MEYLSGSQAETERLGEALGRRLSPGAVVALNGPLGAGKTAFVRGLCRAFGYKGDVTSPTFALAHQYEGDVPITHFDLYRLDSADADTLESIGFYDALDGRSVLAVEWSERIEGELPESAVIVNMAYGKKADERLLRIEGGSL